MMKGQGTRRRGCVLAIAMLLILALGTGMIGSSPTAVAAEYDPKEAGHPLKLIAYLVAPVGTLLDYGLMRPAFWLVQKQPFRALFGYDYMAQEDDRYSRSGRDATP